STCASAAAASETVTGAVVRGGSAVAVRDGVGVGLGCCCFGGVADGFSEGFAEGFWVVGDAEG
ncbi:hypothetical protein, partial [Streptomyces glaucescens]|uniref:hypothetical protein n=1 Tax=Streptomyces glaucescens TaxID=1907 RepID=UPI0013022ABC